MEALRIVRVKAGPEVARPARKEALPQRQQTRRKKMFLLLLHNNLDFYPRSRDILRRYILKHDVIIVGASSCGRRRNGATRSSYVDFWLRADKHCALNGLFILWTNEVLITAAVQGPFWYWSEAFDCILEWYLFLCLHHRHVFDERQLFSSKDSFQFYLADVIRVTEIKYAEHSILWIQCTQYS